MILYAIYFLNVCRNVSQLEIAKKIIKPFILGV